MDVAGERGGEGVEAVHCWRGMFVKEWECVDG